MVNIPGFSPKREAKRNDDGTYTITVTPPAFMQVQPKSLTLTQKQYVGYLEWQNGQLIQEALPDLTASQRELLMSGLDDAEFKAAVGGEDDE